MSSISISLISPINIINKINFTNINIVNSDDNNLQRRTRTSSLACMSLSFESIKYNFHQYQYHQYQYYQYHQHKYCQWFPEEDPDLIIGTRLVVITHNRPKRFHLYSLVLLQYNSIWWNWENPLYYVVQIYQWKVEIRIKFFITQSLLTTGQSASTCTL